MGAKPGLFEACLYSDAVHFKEGNQWTEIDSGLSGLKGGKRTSKANSFDVQFADQANDPTLATLVLDSGHFHSGWREPLRSKPKHSRQPDFFESSARLERHSTLCYAVAHENWCS